MNHLEDEDRPHREREITLSTGTILGIFLGLAVLCGGFFGFGYNVGRKSAPVPLTLNESSAVDPPASTSDAANTSPSESNSAPVTLPEPARNERHTTISTHKSENADGSSAPEPEPKHISKPSPSVAAGEPVKAPAAPIVRPTPAPAPPATGAGSGNFVVQVAAVSHQEDANLLLSALRARGYAVSAHPGSNDSFIHVQVGPFHDKKEADAMRQRLLTDGYNAIVK